MKEKAVFDFGASDALAGWFSINDTVMGGLSESTFTADDEGGTAVFAGILRVRGGGFASTRSPSRHFALTGAQGLEARVKGDGKAYRLYVMITEGLDGILYRYDFGTEAGKWQEVRAPFDDFVPTYHGQPTTAPELDAGQIRHMGFVISDEQEGPFRLEVAWIRAFGKGKPAASKR